jgi:spore coat assembly protein
MNVGSFVTRKSYKNDINFLLVDILGNNAVLTGLDYRLIADAPLSDLEYANLRNEDNESELFNEAYKEDLITNWNKQQIVLKTNEAGTTIPSGIKCGTVLHIDGDPFYLKICMSRYEKSGVSAVGVSVEESKQPAVLLDLLKQYKPNILVITGHDSLKKKADHSMNINDYRNSKYFVECVKIAREYNPNYDELVIIAGGCKSHYEAIMKAGANYASSPDRLFINITDPVYVACKLANTSIKDIIDIDTITRDVFSGVRGIGGIETRGQCREVKPVY